MKRLAGISVFVLLAGCAGPEPHQDVRDVLSAQEQAWNRGDLEGFVSYYWKSEKLVFTTPTSEAHGWEATLERYRKSYPTPQTMGHLRFDEIVISQIDEHDVRVSGRFHVKRKEDSHSGRFYLTMRHIDGAWVITKDHTVAD